MNKTNIILTGFMGTGKSTVGRRLANALGYRFVDTDNLIEERIGKSIAQLFADEGEAVFRQMEAELVEELAATRGLVIATGGGLMMNPQNVAHLQNSGQIFCLTASAEEILERVSRQPDTRPLLKDPNPLQKIRELLAQRAPTYAQFTQVSTSGGEHQVIVKRLLKLIEG